MDGAARRPYQLARSRDDRAHASYMCGMKSLLPAFALLLATPLLGQTTVDQLAEGELPSLLSIYKDLHAHPELSTREEQTSALVAKELRAAGCEVTDHFGKYDNPNFKGYGVIGLMKNGPGPLVLVRTDMDALPVEEETGLPYASKVYHQERRGPRRSCHARLRT